MKLMEWITLLLVLSAAQDISADTVKIGEMEVSADCALARNERPRLLFRGRDLPEYKRRIASEMKEDYEAFRAYWDKEISAENYDWDKSYDTDGVCLGVLYQLTGDRRYADAVRATSTFQKGSIFWVHPFTLDLIIDSLPPEEVRRQADLFLDDIEKRYKGGMQPSAVWPAIALYGAGSGRDEELARWLAIGLSGTKEQIAALNVWAADRGGDVNSFSYVGNHSMIRAGAAVAGVTNALGLDLWQECTWMRHLGSYYVYHFPPWRHGAIHVDNTRGLPIGPKGADFGGAYLLHAAPARYRDGLYQWWVDRLLVDTDTSLSPEYKRRRRDDVMSGLWGKILFRDPDVPSLGPSHFPPSRLFLTRGFASMRESWGEDATMVHFICGAKGNLGDLRHNADNNTFSIYKRGILALDTGGQHALDAYALKLDPPGRDHNWRYSSETIAHNGVLVYHEVDDALWKKYGKYNTGGQILRQPPQWDRMRGVERSGTSARRGKITAWETSTEYDYVCGDATASYSPTTVESFTRQLVYVRPDLIFVFDRIETARDGCRATWLLHTADRPHIDGKETADDHIHPDGHFLWEGSVITVDDNQMGGRTFCKMLLPERREVRLLGGQGHEFELPDGTNVGPTPETYNLPADGREIRESRAEGEGLRGWRIETEDRSGKRSVRFLHVFQTWDQDILAIAPTTLVRRDGMIGAQVQRADVAIEVLFRNEGESGGQVSFAGSSRPLTTQVEDHYQRWKGHPDHRQWTTDPYRRSVVFGENP